MYLWCTIWQKDSCCQTNVSTCMRKNHHHSLKWKQQSMHLVTTDLNQDFPQLSPSFAPFQPKLVNSFGYLQPSFGAAFAKPSQSSISFSRIRHIKVATAAALAFALALALRSTWKNRCMLQCYTWQVYDKTSSEDSPEALERSTWRSRRASLYLTALRDCRGDLTIS